MNRFKRFFAAGTALCMTGGFGFWLTRAMTRPEPIEPPTEIPMTVLPEPPRKTPPAKPAVLTAKQFSEYREAIGKTAGMVGDPATRSIAAKLGLNVLNVTWEDTGRYKGSSVGPNISDMTIQVAARDPKTGRLDVTCMPVIRKPNFSDETTDLDPRDFTLLVGNERDGDLKRISLHDLLENPTAYLFNPGSWKSPKKTLLAPRDARVLVSAQACFLPIPKSGKATFNPVLFNYQSYSGDPAVLTILATREGTSVTVIDNKRDAFETGAAWGQRLFHNAGGQRASLTGERESDFRATADPSPDHSPTVGRDKTESGLNLVLLIQVPLKQKQPMDDKVGLDNSGMVYKSAPMAESRDRSDIENAVIGHGDLEGPFTEIDNLDIERDDRFPVRVTVQFYKATSNGAASAADLTGIKQQIDRVYAQGDYVGSLVTQGETGRITEYQGVKIQPADWWEQFWQRHEKNTGDTREVAVAKLRQLLGKNYQTQPVCELYLRSLLRPEQPTTKK